MTKNRKTWREKLNNAPAGLPKVVDGPEKCEKRFGGTRVLVPTPLLVDKVIRTVKKGKLITVNQIREKLAQEFNADSTCQITTGIFIRICAEVAEEDLQAEKKSITPYWRVLKSEGSLNTKYPGGVESQAKHLISEGHEILTPKSRKPPKVKDFINFLIT
ncbi:MAG: MGMT family protein [Sedimentisphaerales bacterium]|nr:MGMT family protein [Sedimentisphaerales bacterium]